MKKKNLLIIALVIILAAAVAVALILLNNGSKSDKGSGDTGTVVNGYVQNDFHGIEDNRTGTGETGGLTNGTPGEGDPVWESGEIAGAYEPDGTESGTVYKISDIPEVFGWPEKDIFSVKFRSLLKDHYEIKLVKKPDGTVGFDCKNPEDGSREQYALVGDECVIGRDINGRVYAAVESQEMFSLHLKIFQDGRIEYVLGITDYSAVASWLADKYTQLDDGGTVITGNAVRCAEIGGAMFNAAGLNIYRWTDDQYNQVYRLIDYSSFDWSSDNQFCFVYKDGWFYTLQGRVNINGEFVGNYYREKDYCNCGYLIGATDQYLVGYDCYDDAIIRLNYDGTGRVLLTRGDYDRSYIYSANISGNTLCCVYEDIDSMGAEKVKKAELIDINTGAHTDIGLGDLAYAELYGDYLIYYPAGSKRNASMYVLNMATGEQYELLDTMSYDPEWTSRYSFKYTVYNDYIIYPYISDSKMIVCTKLDGSVKDELLLTLDGYDYLEYMETVNGRVFCKTHNIQGEAYTPWIDITDRIP